MTTPLHEKLHFDTANGQVLDQSRRYLLMRTDVLMGLFDNLPQETREQALCALGQSVASFGSDSVRAYAAQPEVDESALLSTMQDAAASLGWGCWQFERTPNGLQLTVRNSPFVAGTAQRGSPACHAITGMFKGLISTLYPGGAKVRELSCAAQAGNGACFFEARTGLS
ncbi:MAG: V4R domain-containing protein [Rhodoferax sp.]